MEVSAGTTQKSFLQGQGGVGAQDLDGGLCEDLVVGI